MNSAKILIELFCLTFLLRTTTFLQEVTERFLLVCFGSVTERKVS